MKKTSIKIGISLAVVSVISTSLFAFDIVYDPVQTSKSIAEYAKQAERWTQQAAHYKSQLEAYKNQLLSQTGVRDSVQFAKDIESFYNFSKSSKEFLSLSGNTSSAAQALYNKYNLFEDCKVDYFNSDEKRICENKIKRKVQEIAVYQEYSKTLDTIGTNIKNLGNKLVMSQDIKESQDIQNAIQLQVAQLDLTKTQVELMNSQGQRLDQIEIKQNKQIMHKRSMTPDTHDYNDW
ncbi:MAG: type IV secretion system protein [Sulfurovaceae bacterium]|nr:type IV secretion system protein [Sulfurovaceae bacterium]